ncbi:MAG: 50S ribosomal protein L17 [Candidatus Omnitrophota bacterium]
MRHKFAGNRLGRDSTLRKATMRDLARAIFVAQRICTTKAKAKEARKLIERLITLGKRKTLSAKRKAFSILCDHTMVSDLFNKIAPRFNNRMGGYTRIIPLGKPRRGDNAFRVFLELTEKEIIVKAKPVTTTKAKSEAKETGAAKKETSGAATIESKKEKTAEQHPKQEAASHEHRDHETPDKNKLKPPAGKKIMGGIKKIFNKKPSG